MLYQVLDTLSYPNPSSNPISGPLLVAKQFLRVEKLRFPPLFGWGIHIRDDAGEDGIAMDKEEDVRKMALEFTISLNEAKQATLRQVAEHADLGTLWLSLPQERALLRYQNELGKVID
ncbi:hypothetical protein PILCRDRAFT_88864 [Piloderma croceum F 1598]|uniref:Uncharacterized protein n=1 Tax=Piloderma croceum (strain F 1598) TaxID=765440 RepID=A0A0C3BXP8_PILCF|nr:hypothetical protein PILCRDRAFT_88864 [Piloderma croceum F 1598]